MPDQAMAIHVSQLRITVVWFCRRDLSLEHLCEYYLDYLQ